MAGTESHKSSLPPGKPRNDSPKDSRIAALANCSRQAMSVAGTQPRGNSNEEFTNSIQFPHDSARASDLCGDRRELRY